MPEKNSQGKWKKMFAGSKAVSRPLYWWRRGTQTAFLILMGTWSFYGVFRCPFIVPYVSCQNCPVITCHGRLTTLFWGAWLMIPLTVIFFGRSFCGWVCPGGMVNQVFGIMAPVKLRLKNIFTSIIPYFKYPALAVALYFYFVMGQPRENIPIRIGGFFNSVLLTFEHANMIWLIRSFIVIGFLALGLILANAWCRFACPFGGILDALKSFSLFKVFKTEKCNDCDKCRRVCHMGTRPAEVNCTNCCDCSSVCPVDAIKIGRKTGEWS